MPDRFEFGTLSFELLAGVTAAVDLLAGLDDEATRRPPCAAADRHGHCRGYENGLLERLLTGLSDATVCPAPEERCPTVSFRVDGQPPAATATALGDQGICVFAGDYYAYEYFTAMGLRDSGGAVRASIYHYNTEEEVDRLLHAVRKL